MGIFLACLCVIFLQIALHDSDRSLWLPENINRPAR
jgi:hypothetical protein